MKRGMTLVEVVIVVSITAILVGIVFNLGWDYLRSLEFKQDRENYVTTIEETIVRARTTSYYDGVRYTYMDITLNDTSVTVRYGTGAASIGTCGAGGLINQVGFEKSRFSGGTIELPYTIRLEPYEMGCALYCSPGSYGSTGTITTASTVSDDETCFYFDGDLCKFSQIACN